MSINKYRNGKLYKIVSNDSTDIYVGSTCEKLSTRLAHHRGDYQKYLKGNKHFITAYELLKQPHYEIILIENVPCASKE